MHCFEHTFDYVALCVKLPNYKAIFALIRQCNLNEGNKIKAHCIVNLIIQYHFRQELSESDTNYVIYIYYVFDIGILDVCTHCY